MRFQVTQGSAVAVLQDQWEGYHGEGIRMAWFRKRSKGSYDLQGFFLVRTHDNIRESIFTGRGVVGKRPSDLYVKVLTSGANPPKALLRRVIQNLQKEVNHVTVN